MLSKLASWLGGDDTAKPNSEIELAEAAAALMIEVAHADASVDPEEVEHIEKLVSQAEHSELCPKGTVDTAHALSQASVSLFEFTSVVNAKMSDQEKYDLVVDMWRIAWVDGHIEPNEEQIIRRVADLIYLPHSGFIHARNRARDEYQAK